MNRTEINSQALAGNQQAMKQYTGKGAIEANKDQFFTPALIIKFMWALIKRLGMVSGNALEPSCGSGRFFEYAPNTLNLTGVEYEQDAFNIAQSLYGSRSNIYHQSFEQFSQVSPIKYDLVIGNVPFGVRATIGHDKQYQNLTKHELYFLAKSLDMLKENGFVCLIVPASIMSGSSYERFRAVLDAKSDLITSYRLSQDLFKESGAMVLTDIIVLKKGSTGQNQNFVSGKYFDQNPNNVMGVPCLDRWGKPSVGGKITFDMLANALKALRYLGPLPAADAMPVIAKPEPKIDPVLEAIKLAGSEIDLLIKSGNNKSEALAKLNEFKATYTLAQVKKYAKRHSEASALLAAWDLQPDQIVVLAAKPEPKEINAHSLLMGSLDHTIDPDLLPSHLHHELDAYFKIPGSNLYTTFEHYCSGDIYAKIDHLSTLHGQDDLIDQLRAKLKHTSLCDAHISLRDKWIDDRIKNEFLKLMNQLSSQWSSYGLINWDTQGFYSVFDHDAAGNVRITHNSELLEKYLNHQGMGGRDHTKETRIQEMSDLEASFKDWVCASPYAEHLQSKYNRLFNGYIQPVYSTEPLEIPNFNFKLHGYQNQAVRKMLDQGSGIMALDVGLGKTLTAIALAAKLKADGRANKPAVVVPKSVMANWKREIDRSTSNLKILYVGEIFKENGKSSAMSKAAREVALKQCALQDWDLVVFSDSAFQQIPLSPEASQDYSDTEFYNDQYGNDLTLYKKAKAIDSHICRTELRKFMNVSDQTFFDDLGIDALIYDEGHALKNFKGSKQQSRINYLPSGDGAKRSFDFNAKAAMLRANQKHANVFLLTATPTKNNPLEIYAMVSHIAPGEWINRGIHNVDQFIDHYGEIANKQILSPKGDYYDAQCLIGFNNLNQLRDILFKYTDMRNAQEVGLKLPDSENILDVSEMDSAQLYAYEVLRERAETMKQENGDKDHLFRIMHSMETMTFCPQIKDYAFHPDYFSPKMIKVCSNALANLHKGSQIIFTSDLLVASHNVIFRCLLSLGAKPEDIKIANGETLPKSSDRQRVSNDFNSGKIKILIGNDGIIGQGMNLQELTAGIHHASLPWTPADITQRNGRGLRQGNTNELVQIFYYFSKGAFDAIRHQALMRKADWIGDLWRGQADNYINEQAQSNGGLDPIELQIMLSPDPDAARISLESLKKSAMQNYLSKKRINLYKSYKQLCKTALQLQHIKDNYPNNPILVNMQANFEASKQLLADSELFDHRDLVCGDLVKKDVAFLSDGQVLVVGDICEAHHEVRSNGEYSIKLVTFEITRTSSYDKTIGCKLLVNHKPYDYYSSFSLKLSDCVSKGLKTIKINPDTVESIKLRQDEYKV